MSESADIYLEDPEAFSEGLQAYFQDCLAGDAIINQKQHLDLLTARSFDYFEEHKLSISPNLQVDGLYFWVLKDQPGLIGSIAARINTGRSAFDFDINALSRLRMPGDNTRQLVCFDDNLFYYATMPGNQYPITLDQLVEQTAFDMMHCYAGVGKPSMLVPANEGVGTRLRNRFKSFTVTFTS